MQITAAFLSIISVASAITVSYDTGYDNGDRAMSQVTCSDGTNGLMARFATQSKVPGFPKIGGASVIEGWNSANCGTCWRLSYNGNHVDIIAIDKAGAGFNIAKAAMDELTGGQALSLGRIDAQYQQLAASACGL